MIPLITTTVTTLRSQLRSLRDTFSFDEDLKINDAIEHFNIRAQFPRWLIDRDSNSSDSFFIPFVQRYYDWLYSDDGYGLGLHETGEVQFLKFIDIDKTPNNLLPHFFYTYASGFPLEIFQSRIEQEQDVADPEDDLSNQILAESSYIRDFIKNIRQNLYQRKSNEKAFQYFFQTLYGVGPEVDGYTIEYPKKYILRLNGGIPPGYNYHRNEDDEIVGGSFHSKLNESILQDGYWYQDYSYLLNVPMDAIAGDGDIQYEDILKGVLHPAGMLGLYQVTLEDYIPPDGTDDDYGFAEHPVLGNYFPYRLIDTEGLTGCVGCSGSEFTYDGIGYSHGGLSGAGIAGWSGATFDMPTYHFPNWARGITNTTSPNGTALDFGYIHIGDFKFLYEAQDSPNLGITGCTGYCDSNAGSCWPTTGC